MGAVQNVVDRIRRIVAADKERGGELLAKGSTAPTYPDSGYDLLQAYGYDALSDYLRLEHDLLSRYVDYEEMDDYPEISCISGNLRLLVATLPRDMVSSGQEDIMGFTCVQTLTVRELYEEYEAGRSDCLYVFALDHEQGRVRVVKAIGPRKTGENVQVYRVAYESYRHEQSWSVTCTGDHLFMLRDGSYRAAMDLEPGDRLMPCTLRTSSIGYSTVYEPLKKTPSSAPVYANVHGLVAEALCGRPLTDQEIVHHKDRDKTNFRPSNLEITSTKAHVREHVQSEEDEERRIALVSEGLRKKWADPEFKKRVSESQRFRDPRWLEAERAGKHKHYEARGELSDAHRAAIAKGRTIPLAKDVVDATLRASASINEAASRLGVSWNTLVRRMDQYGLDRDIVGSNLGGPQPGDGEYLNHRVVSVEKAGFEDVYDLEVPEYHNFSVGTDEGGFIFVHNSAVDIYADDASQPDTQLQRSVWVSSPDKTLQGVLDDLFYKRLRLDEEIWEITRSLCIAEGQRVWTSKGPKPIEEVRPGDWVQSYKNGESVLCCVKRVMDNGEREVWRLRTRHRELIATKDHPVLVRGDDGEDKWVKIEDLVLCRFSSGGIDSSRTSQVVISTSAPEPLEVSPHECSRISSTNSTSHEGTLTYSHFRYEPGFCAEAVNHIEKWGVSRVFDLEIDDDSHNFIVEGLPVHNCKYGNDFEEMLVTKDGVVGLNFLPAPTVRRVEGPRGELYGFVQDFKGRFGYSPSEFQKILAQRTGAIRMAMQPGGAPPAGDMFQRVSALESWEVVHFRLRGKHRRSVYGHAILEPARWIWKRLMLLEDAAMIYRLQRAPERYAFYVDVGDLPPGEALAFVNKIRQQHKKKRFVNPSSGKLDMKFEPLPVAHDTPIPLLDGRTLSIEEMAQEHKSGEKHWVYSIDRESGKVVPGEVSWVGKTRENGRALRLTFDDGGTVVMAPDHPVMLRTGEYREAELLQVGDRVKPLYRKVSSHAKGDGLDGYELVFDPARSGYRYTHRVVSDTLGLRESAEQVTHHKDFNRLNNDPRNLIGMWREDHIVLHTELGHLGGKRVTELRKTDKVLDARLRAASSRNILVFNTSLERSALTARTNRERDQASIVRRYNESPLHAEHDVVRAEKKRAFWADEERAAKAREAMSHTYPKEFVEGVRGLVESGEATAAEQVVRCVNAGPLLRVVRQANPRKPIRKVHRHLMLKVYRSEGYDDFADFKRTANGNHKIVAIEEIEPCDHYCMTVERWHNFALSLRGEDGEPMYRSGVFVKNSQDDDFWVPVRKGVEGTRIEVLGGPSWQHMDDVEYFQTKMFSALKVPKAYLAQDDNTARAVLCLVGDTRIPLLDGRTLTMKELAEEYGTNEEFCVYSCDEEGKVVVGRARGCAVTRPGAEVWEVELDDGTTIRGTPDHPFLMRDGVYKNLAEIVPGESLMPLYRKEATGKGRAEKLQGYEMVQHPKDGSWEYTHRIAAPRRGATYMRVADRHLVGGNDRPNHKVMAVRFSGYEDCYDCTVEKYHNFAVATTNGSGVFVHNSSEDVRFARSVLRVQREVRNGLGKIARTHLAALNVDPYSVEYAIHMTVPSAIFELAQLEVRNARADLAARMREHVSLRWVLENVYQLSNEDITIIIQERSEDTIREGKAQAEVEKLSAMAQAAAQGATASPEAGGEGVDSRTMSGLRLLERRLATLPAKLRRGISEKELMHGNREAEKRAEGKLDRLLRENSQQSKHLREVGALLRDVVAASNGR